MHIKKETVENSLGDFTAWCGERVSGFDRAYLSIDNALKAIQARVGSYPCQKCLREISDQLQTTLKP